MPTILTEEQHARLQSALEQNGSTTTYCNLFSFFSKKNDMPELEGELRSTNRTNADSKLKELARSLSTLDGWRQYGGKFRKPVSTDQGMNNGEEQIESSTIVMSLKTAIPIDILNLYFEKFDLQQTETGTLRCEKEFVGDSIISDVIIAKEPTIEERMNALLNATR
tara:strand:- start:69 stop:566 length:498 start_codon:yes stop_codon:yes gene_type:complete